MGTKRECGEILVGAGIIEMGGKVAQDMSGNLGVGSGKAAGTGLGSGLGNIAEFAKDAVPLAATLGIVGVGFKMVLNGFDPDKE